MRFHLQQLPFPALQALCWGGLLLSSFSVAEETSFDSSQIQFFENEIRPLLSDNCLECHTGTKAKVGLQLNHRRGWLKGSDYRPVINQENAADSLVLHAINQTPGKNVKPMPYERGKIAAEKIAKLTKWIEMGLPWPESPKDVPDDPRQHWSFQTVAPSDVPADSHPIDFFLRKARKAAGVSPAIKADRSTLFRRASFTLLGLPPEYEDLKEFVEDSKTDSEAWETMIQAMMASPHYGERWARLWMDVARYSDTKGYEAGGRERRFVYSYAYRDWLIKALNKDMPYDQFLIYQLAAEQLVDWNGPEKEHLAAMGFLSLSKNGRSELIIDDRIDTTFRGMMALTVACARCHDHKFDPIPTKEYYSLYSIFSNSLDVATPVIGEPKSGPEYEKYLQDLAEKQKVIDDFLEPKLAKIAEENPNLANRRIQLVAKLDRVDRRELQNKQRVVDKFVADAGMEPDKAIILKDKETPSGHAVFIRGNPARRGEAVQRHFLSIASPGEPAVYQKGSGRLEMAKDIASAENPLTARNIVNRVWMWHFGEGIVRTIDDFGIQGEKPDHPELLDYLAHWFVENGWSLKKLHHLIMTSDAWQQSSANSAAENNMLVDSENRLLWKFNRRRLELEQMRDAVLDVAGSLSDQMYGRAVKILEPPYSTRRSVYAFIDRQNLNPIFRNFDFSNPQETTAKRPRTTIPMQALFTLNSDFMQNQAALLADTAKKQEDGIGYLHKAVFASEPSESDRVLADSFLTAFESESASLGKRQTNTEWSYGWGTVDQKTGKVTFQPYPHWTGETWQIAKEYPLKDNPLSYLHARSGSTHPGYTSNESAIYQWRAPKDMTVTISGLLERSSVGKGNGVRVFITSESSGILFDQVLDPSKDKLVTSLKDVTLAKNERLYFLVDPHENNSSFDSVRWSPQVLDQSGAWPKSGLAETFSGPATPATAWSAYTHALLNTNRFLFVE
ncbi:MAG: PSD1 and planctomycete cytochrome C domain-containing protein [Verrucomicrobiales bacterium]|nr:PSD1 and planctomycete cytochrome C domain-containing protein [Verrucomicrobiales bacterium]